jgi:hypothetical protein
MRHDVPGAAIHDPVLAKDAGQLLRTHQNVMLAADVFTQAVQCPARENIFKITRRF